MKTACFTTTLACARLRALAFASSAALAADLPGSVQGSGKPIAGSTVTLFAADRGTPTKLAQAKTDDQGAFKLTYGEAPTDSVLYVIARGGTPKAAADKGPNDAVACWPCWAAPRQRVSSSTNSAPSLPCGPRRSS